MGFQLPIHPEPGQVQVRMAPVASVTIWMDWRRSRASLVPSGETPTPPRSVARIFSGTVSLVSWVLPVAGSKTSLKKTVGALLSRSWPCTPAGLEEIFHQRWAASTNVRWSAVPLTQVKTLYGRGGLNVARTRPVTVERNCAVRA